MPAFLTEMGAAIAAHALKLALGFSLLLAAAGGGFVWGDAHAARTAMEAAAKEADARVAALQKNYDAITQDYLGKLKAQGARGDDLAAALTEADSRLAGTTAKAKEAIAHAVPPDPACDIPAAAVGVLRAQPARQ